MFSAADESCGSSPEVRTAEPVSQWSLSGLRKFRDLDSSVWALPTPEGGNGFLEGCGYVFVRLGGQDVGGIAFLLAACWFELAPRP